MRTSSTYLIRTPLAQCVCYCTALDLTLHSLHQPLGHMFCWSSGLLRHSSRLRHTGHNSLRLFSSRPGKGTFGTISRLEAPIAGQVRGLPLRAEGAENSCVQATMVWRTREHDGPMSKPHNRRHHRRSRPFRSFPPHTTRYPTGRDAADTAPPAFAIAPQAYPASAPPRLFIMVAVGTPTMSVHQPVVRHATLKTSFIGIQHAVSTPDAPVNQFRGIKYASVPGRFRHSQLFAQYHSRSDATRYG